MSERDYGPQYADQPYNNDPFTVAAILEPAALEDANLYDKLDAASQAEALSFLSQIVAHSNITLANPVHAIGLVETDSFYKTILSPKRLWYEHLAQADTPITVVRDDETPQTARVMVEADYAEWSDYFGGINDANTAEPTVAAAQTVLRIAFSPFKSIGQTRSLVKSHAISSEALDHVVTGNLADRLFVTQGLMAILVSAGKTLDESLGLQHAMYRTFRDDGVEPFSIAELHAVTDLIVTDTLETFPPYRHQQ